MFKVLNFSHPLSEKAFVALRELANSDYDNFKALYIPVQIDFDKPIGPQVDRLVEYALREAPFDAIIPPGLSTVAAPLCAQLAMAQGVLTPVVVMKREGVPPKFIPSEIM